MKAEIDALQTHVMRDQQRGIVKYAPNIATIAVALITLLFSIWVNQSSNQRLAQQDLHAARAELRSLLQRLNELPRETFELNRTYADDPDARSFFGSAIQAETVLLSQQAADLIDELGPVATADEYQQVAYALANAGTTSRAEAMVDKGLAIADTASTTAGLLRQSAQVRFTVGDLDGGRDRWQDALDVFDRFPNEAAHAMAGSRSFTEAMWASAELFQGNCAEAADHIAKARELAAGVASSPWVDQGEAAVQGRCSAAPSP